MEHYNLLLNQLKPNEIEFDVTVEGLEASEDMMVNFVIETEEFGMEFKCEKREDGKWVAKLPSLPVLEKETYPFRIEVITDGYYFSVAQGTLNVVGSADVYVSKPDIKFKPPVNKPEVKEVPPSEEAKPEVKPEENVESVKPKAKPMIETKLQLKDTFIEKKNPEKKKEEKPISNVNKETDKKVKEALESLQSKEKPKKAQPFSFKKVK